MEPSVVLMGRGPDYANLSELKIDTKQRRPGDGMEAHMFDKHSELSPTSYKKAALSRRKLNVQSPRHSGRNSKKKRSKDVTMYSLDDIDATSEKNYSRSHQDLVMMVDTLKTKLKLIENHNDQLVEEKMKLSHQLGIQTQVNNELKKLLVASIGDDLQQRYERMIEDKYLADLELHHLHNVLEGDREEVEQAMIQADVWRSKFFASRVMNDELARWKSALYYKYRETHTALQNLLEEHSKLRALNNATRRGLVKVVDILGSKDPSLDMEASSLTTIDVAYMNNDLTESIHEIMIDNDISNGETKMIENEVSKLKSGNISSSDLSTDGGQLTHAENLAQQVVLNPGIQTEELSRLRRDYLAHNRISHFLSTNYHVTFNCCENCKGPVDVV